ELLGADVDAVRKGVGTDSRIGKRFLFAGIGYGGSCFPKDVQALAKSAGEVDYDFRILKSVMDVNRDQKIKMVPRIKDYFGGSLEGKTIALWGLAFKPYTDDIREAPALYNIDELTKAGAKVKCYDPEAMENVKKQIGNKVTFCHDAYEATDGADALFIATEWPVFRTPDFDRIKQGLSNHVIFDGRNLYSLDEMDRQGFTYFSIGRATIHG
ncbi:MAG: UDP binding domain-containing protein, partial [Bacteroidota bacterium]